MSDLSTELFRWFSVERNAQGTYEINWDKFHGSKSCFSWGYSNPSKDAGDVYDPVLEGRITRQLTLNGSILDGCFFAAYRREDNSEVVYIAIPEKEGDEEEWN